MKQVFHEVDTLDKRCYEKYALSEDILMENASSAIRHYIYKKFPKQSKILIVTGSGNNGADGIALARSLHGAYQAHLYLAIEPKSKMALLQYERAQKIGVPVVSSLEGEYLVVIDCIFGSGLSKPLGSATASIIETLNNKTAHKIACDIPSGAFGAHITHKQGIVFQADHTFTMGALKTSLFEDKHKDFVGKIKVVSLGLSTEKYEDESQIFCLQKSDLTLPFRTKQNTHKGEFGHICVVASEDKNAKLGAGILALKAGLALGAGLCTLRTNERYLGDPEIMLSQEIPKNANAIGIGMGLGEVSSDFLAQIKSHILDNNLSCVIDADLFYTHETLDFLEHKKAVLTPHPKEFCSLLALTKTATISLEELQNNRFLYLEKISQKYPNCTILLKGANTLIASEGKIYINPHGSSALSKGGSGDVLAGVILAYLAQGFSARESAVNGSLVHAIGSGKVKNNFALTPMGLIEGMKEIQI